MTYPKLEADRCARIAWWLGASETEVRNTVAGGRRREYLVYIDNADREERGVVRSANFEWEPEARELVAADSAILADLYAPPPAGTRTPAQVARVVPADEALSEIAAWLKTPLDVVALVADDIAARSARGVTSHAARLQRTVDAIAAAVVNSPRDANQLIVRSSLDMSGRTWRAIADAVVISQGPLAAARAKYDDSFAPHVLAACQSAVANDLRGLPALQGAAPLGIQSEAIHDALLIYPLALRVRQANILIEASSPFPGGLALHRQDILARTALTLRLQSRVHVAALAYLALNRTGWNEWWAATSILQADTYDASQLARRRGLVRHQEHAIIADGALEPYRSPSALAADMTGHFGADGRVLLPLPPLTAWALHDPDNAL